MGWFVLNGHCASDPLWHITCVHCRFTLVIDLTIMLWVAHTKVVVLPVCLDGCNHRALLVMVLVVPSHPVLCSPVLPPDLVQTVCLVWVKLTSGKVMVFCGFDCLQVAG